MTNCRWRAARVLPSLAALVLVAGSLVACGGSEVDLPDQSDRLLSPPAEPDPPQDPEHAVVLAAYTAYIEAFDEAARRGDPEHPDLAERAEGLALAAARSNLESYLRTDWVYTGGRTVVAAEVTNLDWEPDLEDLADLEDLEDLDVEVAVSPIATVTACLDVSEFLPVDANDGTPLATERDVNIHKADATLRFDEDRDRWVVVVASLEWETPC